MGRWKVWEVAAALVAAFQERDVKIADLQTQLREAEEKLEYRAEQHSKHLGGAYRRAEAAERDVSTLQQDVGRAEQELELANQDAEAKGALAEEWVWLHERWPDMDVLEIDKAVDEWHLLTPAEKEAPE